MRSELKRWNVYLAFVIVLAGCGSTVYVEKDKQADFRNYKTFAWLDSDKTLKKENKTGDLVERNIKQAVTEELEKASGWKEVKTRPDILLNYDILVERTVKENSSPVYSGPFTRVIFNPYTRRYATIYYPSRFVGYERDQRPVKEGTVTITMIDARTDKTVWQGWTTDEVNSRNLTSKEIQYSVRSIFKKFDIAKN